MAKKRASNQPIVAEEPARPEEQFHLDEAKVAPPSSRPIGPKTHTTGSGMKTYGARSARERRATRGGSAPRNDSPRRERRDSGLRADVVSNMLEHPTITVTEDQLRQEYGYVVSDLRSMALLAAGLIVALVVLAQILPKL